MARAGELAAGLVDVVYALRLEPDMCFEYVSPSVEAMVGYTPQEHYDDPQLGMRLLDPRDIDVLLEAVQAGVGERVDMTVRWIAKDGHHLWTQHRCVKQVRADGSVVLFGAARDVTEQHVTAERYRLMVENATDIVFHTADGIVQWISPSVTEVLGWTVEEMVGHSTVHLWHPDDLDEAVAMRDATYAGVPHRGRLRCLRKDGTYLWIDVAMQPQTEPDGRVGAVGFMRDVDSEVRAQQALAASEGQFRLLAENAMDLVFSVGLDGTVAWVSPSITTVLGYRSDDIIGKTAKDLLVADALHLVARTTEEAEQGRTMTVRAQFLHTSGEPRWMEATVRPMVDEYGTVVGRVVTARDVDAEVRTNLALEHELSFDSLTGLAKRPVALARIQDVLDTRHAPGWALLCVGVHGMTAINQAYTYAAGDAVLRAVADRLVEAAGAHDRVARIAGDEFVILLRDIITPHDAASAAQRLLAACGGPVTFDDVTVAVSACAGIATSTGHSAEDLLRDATAAMRQAAARGSGRWEFLDGNVGAQTRHALTMESDLIEALRDGSVRPWFMPVVALPDRGVVGYEALAHWTLDDGSTRPPIEFLGIAERSGLILTLDRAMVSQALDTMASLPEEQHVAVNVSAVTLDDGSFETWVRSELERSGVDPRRLHLEVTETALFHVTDNARTTMQDLATIGVAWWIDDFGTGYSSISHLRDLPVSGLKLDVTFTAGITTDDSHATRLAQGLAGLAHGLGLATIAEGVETVEQEQILIGQGWQLGQGWLYGRAAPSTEITRPGQGSR